ncbi:MAG TPA: dihydropteroate synthase [Lachnospiraceae bacterium]|nr:dihydropteroate synthase [Lachnospiraceae bacterium]
MKIGNREFCEHGKTYIMGILNVTPDSFSDGGNWNCQDQALYHVEKMQKDGMDILDVGGESTRPEYTKLSVEEEIERVLPVIRAVKSRFDIPISLDTYKAGVAKAGIEAGIDMVNDIWGLKYDTITSEKENTMGELIARSGLPCCLMHNRTNKDYQSFMQDVAADLSETLYLAEKAGISSNQIILDPGVGFAKSYEQNLQIMNNLEQLRVLGCPLLLGTSRKSVIGLTLDLPVDQRVEGTLATTVIGVMKGCSFVRVHDVRENALAIRMAEAILSSY